MNRLWGASKKVKEVRKEMKTFGHTKKKFEIFLKLDNISKIYNPNEKKAKILG